MKRSMMPVRFTSLIFVVIGLLFTLLLPQDSIAHALHADVEMNMMAKENRVAAFGWNTALSADDQEESDGIRTTVNAGARKEKLGGRKLMMMMVDHRVLKKNENLMNEAAGKVLNIPPEVSEISGRSKSSVPSKSLGESQRCSMIDQKNSNILEPKALSSAVMKKIVKSTTEQDDHSSHIKKHDQVISRCGSWKCSWRLRSKSTSSSEPLQQKIYRSRQLLEDSHYKIVNLIHKDYRGMGNPRRKPPINNHEPLEDDAEP